VTDWAAFVEFGDFVRTWVSSVEASGKAGKTADQAAADVKLPEKFSGYATTRARANVDVIYKEMGK